jgi:hypothetical protein
MGLSAGLNQLDDLILDENFAGVCAFTIDEFDDCFGEWLTKALQKFKENGVMPPRATLANLRKLMLTWYFGYSWDGKTKVLNPIDVLGFFKEFNSSLFPTSKTRVKVLMTRNNLSFDL